MVKNKKRVISRKNLPKRIPLYQAMVAYLMLDKFNASGWVWGVVGTIFFLVTIVSFHDIMTEDEVELL